MVVKNASLGRLCNKSNIRLNGDFNLGIIDWTIPGQSDAKLHKDFIDMLNDNNLAQIHVKPTRNNRIFDQMITANPALANRTETLPPS